mmetsp:Transcript_33570/g.78465  ORF Transcript_33570/g.78465 Transcript_33570/m.78465 type:complete len:377 (-) Transcript_33570:769-1899(-)
MLMTEAISSCGHLWMAAPTFLPSLVYSRFRADRRCSGNPRILLGSFRPLYGLLARLWVALKAAHWRLALPRMTLVHHFPLFVPWMLVPLPHAHQLLALLRRRVGLLLSRAAFPQRLQPHLHLRSHPPLQCQWRATPSRTSRSKSQAQELQTAARRSGTLQLLPRRTLMPLRAPQSRSLQHHPRSSSRSLSSISSNLATAMAAAATTRITTAATVTTVTAAVATTTTTTTMTAAAAATTIATTAATTTTTTMATTTARRAANTTTSSGMAVSTTISSSNSTRAKRGSNSNSSPKLLLCKPRPGVHRSSLRHMGHPVRPKPRPSSKISNQISQISSSKRSNPSKCSKSHQISTCSRASSKCSRHRHPSHSRLHQTAVL